MVLNDNLEKRSDQTYSLYSCKICFKSFMSKSNLDRHLRLHTGFKPYHCSKCNKSFTRKDHLTSHQSNHFSNFEKTKICSVCFQNFLNFQELENHCISFHKRNACMHCNKTFAQRANRDRHLCLHTGAKHHRCHECGERFARSDKLKIHKRKFHQVGF
ncbi:hypothetical protein HELRODRAFT_62097 [Helobdella robusta]|uniref:C2H2-type domain-containing protein n=1 Tax=Helobdella robusta TaxID=6412 RepID=T1FWV8_HELRO|nr:hypothetical protein HELRODRAFT_62097 [Helobdella robusta]ESO12194.1 hypothetical protein HELRODRAFT_62097 [Helobdella robusta]